MGCKMGFIALMNIDLASTFFQNTCEVLQVVNFHK
jgi:hypothetical protein